MRELGERFIRRCLPNTALEVTGLDLDFATCDNGQAGLDQAMRDRPDLILSDWQMPGGMDGLSLKIALNREGLEDVPFILSTGQDTETVRRNAALIGINTVLGKPCPIDEFQAALNAIFGAG